MTDPFSSGADGRKAEAARNDGRILDAAREVFVADPEAPVAAVAARAGVGISALYRRYPSKQHMLQALARDGLIRFIADLDLAMNDPGDPWEVYASCLGRVLDGQSQALAQRLAGTFAPPADLTKLAARAGSRYAALHRRAQRAGALRKDVTTADVVLLLEAVTSIDIPGTDRATALRRRYLAVILQALRAPAGARLPGPPARDDELAARWTAPTRHRLVHQSRSP